MGGERITRDSNFELLRLVSMLFIILFHFIFYEMKSWTEPVDVDTRHLVSAFITPFFLVAVNCYILISGYFGIKGKYKSLLSFYIQCAFYSLVIYSITSIFVTSNFSVKYFIYGFLPFSHSNGLWFIPSYLSLFLIAPLFNNGVKNLSKEAYLSTLIILNPWCINKLI